MQLKLEPAGSVGERFAPRSPLLPTLWACMYGRVSCPVLCSSLLLQEERETLREQLCAVPAESDPTDIAINVAKVSE